MTTITIPITAPTQRTDSTPLALTDIAYIDVFMSVDNGQNYVSVGHAAPGQANFTQDFSDIGTPLFRAETVDLQTPARTSADSNVVSVTIEPPALAAPNPPVLGTPTIA